MTHTADSGREHDRRALPSMLLTAALESAARGWPVFPLRPGDKRPAGHAEDHCPTTGRCAGGHVTPEQRATTDRARIADCWTPKPYNVGLATGPAGLLVIDLDLPKPTDKAAPPEWAGFRDGIEVFTAICERAGHPVPTGTYTVRTGRGGLHLYFAAPGEKRLRGSAGRLGWKVDTRAWGGYVVAPGSVVHRRPYEVINAVDPIPLPTWLSDLLTPPPAPAPLPVAVVRARIGRADRYATAAMDGELAKLAAAPDGEHNLTLYRAAYALGRLIAAGTLSEQQVTDRLTEAALAKGLTPSRTASSIRDGIRRSTRNTLAGAR
ncbi:bifunctional DNA primase/polymerase [Streptomyces sp. NBC_01214]|uniref:bifunctional DNA primase/polymerase n=1 Tax=Streptomyces sp. NBC_01214 TaxID=2903777 RepID=UPI00224E76C6|nr:bifunctional DNA primase/polymerase [Streptomyces sp. NBC_01214]MCX4805072.1 bifunctional DNA primase/polymerase [Streptomyces sp. NBC_01214]